MHKSRVVHRCKECGSSFARWSGRCPHCGEWNALVESREQSVANCRDLLARQTRGARIRLGDVDPTGTAPISTGLCEFDRALSGGLLPGSVTMIGGEPGVGKSTLLLQVAGAICSAGGRVLVISAEESETQVRRRAERLHPSALLVDFVSTTRLDESLLEVCGTYDLVVVDSIQTVGHDDVAGGTGSISQIRGCASLLVELAKTSGTAIVLVGHVTKDGALAGPRVLEHLVDTVISFEGDRHQMLRIMSVAKHRFGPTGELGVFEMSAAGLVDVADPSAHLLADRHPNIPGSVIVPVMEGRRALLVEVQALVTRSGASSPRRSAEGIGSGRLSLLLAVLEERAGIALSAMDVFSSAVGGVQVSEPGADLGIGLALVSARTSISIGDDVVAIGEVGLGGELRQVANIDIRLKEAARRGYSRAILPRSSPSVVDSISQIPASTLSEAIGALGLV